jgi:threonine 3-dehydrogenase
VLIAVKYAGFCGSDRGIWWRKAFGDMILGSLDDEGRDKRVVGHELLGEIIAVGSKVTEGFGLKPRRRGLYGVPHRLRGLLPVPGGRPARLREDKIIGISMDGCFAERLKLPAKSLWPHGS